MSFLESIVNSIGGDRAPPPPPPPPQKPLNRRAPPESVPPPINSAKNISRSGASSVSAGIKRKAEDDGSRDGAKASRSTTPNAVATPRGSVSISGKPPLPKLPVPQPASKPKSPDLPTSKPVRVTPPATTNPPKKGSYAEMMARAKQSAEQRANSQVGIIKHQETKKERMSRLAEKRKAGQNKSKLLKPTVALKNEGKATGKGGIGPTKSDTVVSAKVKAAEKPAYKGTMGLGASQSRSQKSASRKPRYDEYLGTDEEDDDDDIIDDDDDDGYGSEGSSAMEAGFDDVEDEEELALRAAREDDARELALENQLKREKEERRRKLLGLAKKQR